METIVNNYMVCDECLLFIANGDVPEDGEREAQIVHGVEDAQEYYGGHIVCGDSEKDDDFSWRPCPCCGTKLGGSRHHCAIIGEGTAGKRPE